MSGVNYPDQPGYILKIFVSFIGFLPSAFLSNFSCNGPMSSATFRSSIFAFTRFCLCLLDMRLCPISIGQLIVLRVRFEYRPRLTAGCRGIVGGMLGQKGPLAPTTPGQSRQFTPPMSNVTRTCLRVDQTEHQQFYSSRFM